MSRPLMSSSASTTTRCFLRMSISGRARCRRCISPPRAAPGCRAARRARRARRAARQPGAARGGEIHRRQRALPLMDIRKKQRVVVEALEDIKGRDILVYNTARMPSMFERVVIASGDSTRQVKALADNVQEKLRENGARVYGVEGEANGEWVLVDLGDVVVHIM